jgi:SAM-dependent methyltransferase
MANGHLYDYPRLYDIAFGWDTSAEIDFVIQTGLEHGLRAPLTLYEPFCGTGRLSFPLAAAGHRVYSVDDNVAMLSYARERQAAATDRPGELLFDLGDVRSWQPPERVDAVVALMDSFRHLTTPTAAKAALQRFHAALRPGGLLLLGIAVGEPPVELDEHNHWELERDGTLISTACFDLRQPGFTPGTTLLRIVMHIVEADGKSYDIVSDYEMRRYTRESLAKAVAASGAWTLHAVWDYYTLAPAAPETDTGQLVFIFERIETPRPDPGI